MSTIEIPVDIYDSPTEFVVVVPLGGVEKSSVHLTLQQTLLTITGTRERPMIKESLTASQQSCFWGSFSKTIELPSNSYFNNIHSELSETNILTVIVPKVIVPEEIVVHIR